VGVTNRPKYTCQSLLQTCRWLRWFCSKHGSIACSASIAREDRSPENDDAGNAPVAKKIDLGNGPLEGFRPAFLKFVHRGLKAKTGSVNGHPTALFGFRKFYRPPDMGKTMPTIGDLPSGGLLTDHLDARCSRVRNGERSIGWLKTARADIRPLDDACRNFDDCRMGFIH
jgi:hypothetical protein